MTTSAAPLTVITGASSGIGRELALIAARRGDALLLIARGSEALERTAGETRDAGSPHVVALSADVATIAGVHAVADRAREVAEQSGHVLTTLVNNAGYGSAGAIAEMDEAVVTNMIELNCRSVALLTRLLLEDVIAARGGVLTVASTAAFQPGPGMAVYSASKAFALSFSVALREELRGTGAHATGLCPGPVPTGFQQRAGMGDMRMAKIAEQPATHVAEAAWRGLAANRAVVVPGAANKLGALGARFSPIALTARMARLALGALD